MLKWLFNVHANRRIYNTKWVEDLPNNAQKSSVYIVGGRGHPFILAIPCPRKKCPQVIQVDISDQVDKTRKWCIREDENGSISLFPSVHVNGLPCRCHYWLKHGKIEWCETPKLLVPRLNRK